MTNKKSYYKNLVPGQYQLGDIVMGHGTNIIVEGFDAKPYDINAQDYQVTRSDEVRFGYDSFKPTSIEMNMQVIYNWLLDPFKATRTNFWHNMPSVGDLATEWRGNDIRNTWGEMKPLYFCGRDGIGKMIYGRPGQFSSEKAAENATMVKCVGEFRRADTLSYSAVENYVALSSNAAPQYIRRTLGDADTWFRIVGYGPLTNPIITVGNSQIQLDLSVAADEFFEVSSYPWQRRAVDSNRNNIRNSLVGTTPYLDTMKIPPSIYVPVRWSSSELNTWVPYMGNSNWSVDIEDKTFWGVPDGFTNINGAVKVRFDLFNSTGPTLYLAGRAGLIARTDAAIYNAQKFNTDTQYMQARIVEPCFGRSGMVIMSNITMTSFAMLEVSSGLSNNKLIIRSGTAYNNLSVARATYTNNAVLGWKETDIVGFGYTPSTKTYTAYLNGTAVATWVDSTNIVPTSGNNRYSGFIFDIDGTLLSLGTGFKDITAYDNVVVPADTGSVYLFWRDAWSAID